jgi:Rrf2 family protein
MRVTTWAEYGVIVALNLARRDRSKPVPARDVAEFEHLPTDYVEQIFLRLRRAGLVSSVRGARGGYRLSRDPADISIRNIVEAAEGSTFEVNCEAHPVNDHRCDPMADCSIRPVWRMLKQRIDDALDGVSLDDLLSSEVEVVERVALVAHH